MFSKLMKKFGYISIHESSQYSIQKVKNALNNASLSLPGDEVLTFAKTGRRNGFMIMHINGLDRKYTDSLALFKEIGRPMSEEDERRTCETLDSNSLNRCSMGGDIAEMTQPAHLWFAAAIQKFSEDLKKDEEPTIKIQIGGAVMELSLVGVAPSKSQANNENDKEIL